jgi:NAD(P)-dependent dehydrogenase (short-subunit alcohol dehydrogenase family)
MEEKKVYILMTGASSGIGSCLAIGLSRTYNLILHGRNEERLQNTRSLCDKSKEHLIYIADLAELEDLESSLSQFITENHLEVSHFIHCAGFMKMLPLKSMSVEIINRTFAINVHAAALIVKVLTYRKVNSALKSIVFISSNVSNFGAKAFSIYAGSKAALDSVMRCLAVELAPKIRINSVLPGAISTEMTKGIFEDKDVMARMKLNYPLGLGEANDVFEVVNFLISDKSKWITGQQFVVDGGRTINISG